MRNKFIYLCMHNITTVQLKLEGIWTFHMERDTGAMYKFGHKWLCIQLTDNNTIHSNRLAMLLFPPFILSILMMDSRSHPS